MMEHDPEDIWRTTLTVSQRALSEAERSGDRVGAIGIANQRETTVIWDRETGAPIYNASHLFGFLSVFNADALQHVRLVKGGFPARYGGRLSSVVEITMKEGNRKRYAAEGAVGLVFSTLTVQGPMSALPPGGYPERESPPTGW